jgi:hypothetical protein
LFFIYSFTIDTVRGISRLRKVFAHGVTGHKGKSVRSVLLNKVGMEYTGIPSALSLR